MAKTPEGVDALFDPPWTNVHVGMISGGTAHNITAKDCEFVLTFRCVPGDDPEEWGARFLAEVDRINAEIRKVRPEAWIEVSEKFSGKGLTPEENGAAEELARRLTGDNGTHVVSYGTEAGYFQAHGFSAVVCGPGDIAQAHQPDEYITVEEFEKGHAFMRRLLETLKES
jgi:acetylornithine deacetylase